MKIRDIEFDFNPLNAVHLERMAAAQEAYMARDKEIREADKPDLHSRIQTIRAQCRNIADFIDAMLGDGSSKKLGMDLDDLGDCLAVLQDVTQAAIDTKKKADSGTKNRAQRRDKNAKKK